MISIERLQKGQRLPETYRGGLIQQKRLIHRKEIPEITKKSLIGDYNKTYVNWKQKNTDDKLKFLKYLQIWFEEWYQTMPAENLLQTKLSCNIRDLQDLPDPTGPHEQSAEENFGPA